MARTLLLDLDGTLVAFGAGPCGGAEPADARRAAWRRSPTPETALMVGDGVAKLVERAFAARGRDGRMRRRSRNSPPTTWRTPPMRPGPSRRARDPARAGGRGLAAGGLHQQAGGGGAVAAGGAGLADAFAAIGGGDSFPVRKPDPAHLLATLRQAGGEPAHAVMAGDHANDVAAARGAGLPCIFAAWGYGPPAMAEGAAAIAQNFAELVRTAERLLAVS